MILEGIFKIKLINFLLIIIEQFCNFLLFNKNLFNDLGLFKFIKLVILFIF